MLTCKEITELVTDYLEGQLSMRQQLGFYVHLGTCKHCREDLRQMKATVRTLAKLPVEPMPAKVRDDLLARFRSVRPRSAEPSIASKSVRVLAALERAVGGKRGWVAAGSMLLAALVALFASGLQQGGFGDGSRCVLMELGAGLLPIALLGFVASAKRLQISVGTFTTLGMAGGFIAFAGIEAICPMSHSGQHVLLFHLGGMILIGLVGAATSRLPALR